MIKKKSRSHPPTSVTPSAPPFFASSPALNSAWALRCSPSNANLPPASASLTQSPSPVAQPAFTSPSSLSASAPMTKSSSPHSPSSPSPKSFSKSARVPSSPKSTPTPSTSRQPPSKQPSHRAPAP